MVVVEKGRMRGGCLAGERVVGGAVDQVDVEPSIVVVVEQGHTGAGCFQDELLLGRAHGVMPPGQAGLGGDVLKDHGTGFDKAASGDGAFLRVEDRGVGSTSVHSHGLGWSLRLGIP